MAHGFPVAGGMSQTAVNDMGGATSPVALIVTSGAIALTLLFFATFFHNLPEPVLGAIVLMAALHLVRFEELRRLLIESRAEFWTSMVACVGVLFFGLLNGLLLAAVGSLVIISTICRRICTTVLIPAGVPLIAQTSRPMVVVLGRERSTGYFVSRARNPDASSSPLLARSCSASITFSVSTTSSRSSAISTVMPRPFTVRTSPRNIIAAVISMAGTLEKSSSLRAPLPPRCHF
jgi:sulfate permease, SulP family